MLQIEEIILGLIVFLPHLVMALSPENSLIRWFYTDDAFYYFVTARNISEGFGISFDGINLTNGFHPLWMILMIPVFTLARLDPILPLRLVIVIQSLMSIGAGILMYRLCQRYLPKNISLIVAFTWVLTPEIYQIVTMGGMESGLNAMSITLFWFYLSILISKIRENQWHWKDVFILGLIASITILSRLDNVFLALFSGIWLLIVTWNLPNESIHKSMEALKWKGKLLFLYSLPIILLFGSYAIWNKVSFNSMMPVSGQVKVWWGTLGERPYGSPPSTFSEFYQETFTSENPSLSPWAFAYTQVQTIVRSANNLLNRLGLPAIARNIWLFFGVGILLILDRRFTYKVSVGLSLPLLLLSCLAQIVYYKGTGHVAQRPWYWVSELFFTVLVIGLLVAIIFRGIQRTRHRKIITWASTLIILLVIVSSYLTSVFGIIQTRTVPTHSYISQSKWLADNTEVGSLIGMTNAGAVGYLIQGRTIVNIDGVINSMEYFRHLQTGKGADFLASIGVDYIFGQSKLIKDLPPYRKMFQEKLELVTTFVDEGNEIILWRFIP